MVEHVITPAIQKMIDEGTMRLRHNDEPQAVAKSAIILSGEQRRRANEWAASVLKSRNSEESNMTNTLHDPNAAWNEAVNDIAKHDRISPELAAVELASNPRYAHIAKAAYAAGEQARTLNEMAKVKRTYG